MGQTEVKTNNNDKKFIDKNPHFTIYGKWDSALSLSYIEHKRDDEFKWHKVIITWTPDTFKTKYSLYLEWQELMNILLVVLGKLNTFSAKRSQKISGSNKSVTFSRTNEWDINVKIDDEKLTENLFFRIRSLEKIVLYKLLVTTLIKEYRTQNSVSLTEKDLIDNLEILTNNTFNNDLINNEKENNYNSKSNNFSNSKFKLIYTNSFKGKDYENTIDVNKEVYDYVKANCDKFEKLADEDKDVLVNKIKANTINTDKFFLNKSNIHTLRYS